MSRGEPLRTPATRPSQPLMSSAASTTATRSEYSSAHLGHRAQPDERSEAVVPDEKRHDSVVVPGHEQAERADEHQVIRRQEPWLLEPLPQRERRHEQGERNPGKACSSEPHSWIDAPAHCMPEEQDRLNEKGNDASRHQREGEPDHQKLLFSGSASSNAPLNRNATADLTCALLRAVRQEKHRQQAVGHAHHDQQHHANDCHVDVPREDGEARGAQDAAVMQIHRQNAAIQGRHDEETGWPLPGPTT